MPEVPAQPYAGHSGVPLMPLGDDAECSVLAAVVHAEQVPTPSRGLLQRRYNLCEKRGEHFLFVVTGNNDAKGRQISRKGLHATYPLKFRLRITALAC